MFNPLQEIKDLKTRRQEKGYTTAELARRAGVTHATIRRVEQGARVQADTYKWIEEALNG